ncbi:hypothetical protein P4133_22965 [Pseudomonas aeruginosa]|nr:hypothetical protein [Pseudomonas aeruginosa]
MRKPIPLQLCTASLLGRQAGGQASAALIDVDEELEGGLNVRHAGPGLSGVWVSDALRRLSPPAPH